MSKVFYISYESPVGKIFIASTEEGIYKLTFFQEELEFLKDISSAFEEKDVREDVKFQEIGKMTGAYFEGKPVDFDVSLDLRGTLFRSASGLRSGA